MLKNLWNCEKESYSECKYPVLQKIVDIIKYNYIGYDLFPTQSNWEQMGLIRRKLWEKRIEIDVYDRPLLLRIAEKRREKLNKSLLSKLG